MSQINMKSRAVIRIVDDDAGVRESYKFLIEQMARAFSLVHGRVKRAEDFVNFSVRF